MDTLNVTELLPTVTDNPWAGYSPLSFSPPVKILLTGVGCPGVQNYITGLQEYGYTIVGTDLNPMCYGRFHCDSFYTSPRGDHPNFVNTMLDLVAREKIDVVLPLITAEQMAWAKARWVLDSMNVPIMATNCNAIEVGLDKAKIYRMAEELGIPTAPWFTASKAVSKPTQGKGSQGVAFHDFDEPTVLMEHIDGDETAVDALCKDGEILTCFTRVRTGLRGGLHYVHEIIEDPVLVGHARSIVQHLGYDYFINVQFKGGILMEVNPRISTQFIWGEYNQLHLGIQLALGNLSPDQVREVPPLPIGLKTFYHHAQITYQEDQWPVEEL